MFPLRFFPVVRTAVCGGGLLLRREDGQQEDFEDDLRLFKLYTTAAGGDHQRIILTAN